LDIIEKKSEMRKRIIGQKFNKWGGGGGRDGGKIVMRGERGLVKGRG
jgi:hypothetical protein